MPRHEDLVFEGYEMGDALLAANEALEADVEASADVDDGRNDGVRAVHRGRAEDEAGAVVLRRELTTRGRG